MDRVGMSQSATPATRNDTSTRLNVSKMITFVTSPIDTAFRPPKRTRGYDIMENEGVFEIRDFTNASTFERLSHQISLAARHWAQALSSERSEPGPLELARTEEVLQMKHGFELGGFRRVFQLVPIGETKKEDRLGLHAFPTRAHRLQRWFGVRHFLIVSINNHNIDLDSARTLLSAAVLATAQVSLHPPLSCFVPVEGGLKRVLGEALHGSRTVYCTDLQLAVQPSLEHLAGLSDYFRRKVEISKDEPQDMMVGARFTYSADHFEPWQSGDSVNDRDPIESMKLHCLWPAFRLGAFQDDANSSELLPQEAPYWKLRLLRAADGGALSAPCTARLQALLGFRREAKQIRSAEQSMQTQVPKTAMASLTAAIQESLESILLPTAGEMEQMTESCMASPVVPAVATTSGVATWTAARRGGRLVQMAEFSARMRCFKGAVMLWCSVLGRMRQQWDALEAPAGASPPTQRVPARGVRTEFFDSSMCLAQQKMELLQLSIQEARSERSERRVREAQEATNLASGAIKAPALLHCALLTDDLLLQRDTASASILDATERAELDGREMRADMAAFKAENATAGLEDFSRWREEVEGLSLKPFPSEWLRETWDQTKAKLASEQQQKLFEPFREAEMALHYLESIEGPQLLLQLFRVLLRSTLEELNQQMAEAGNPTYLRVLRDRVISTSSQAFRSGAATVAEEVDVQATLEELAEFPDEESTRGERRLERRPNIATYSLLAVLAPGASSGGSLSLPGVPVLSGSCLREIQSAVRQHVKCVVALQTDTRRGQQDCQVHEHLSVRAVGENERVAQAELQLAKTQTQVPDEKTVVKYLENLRQRDGEALVKSKVKVTSGTRWNKCDWTLLVQKLPSLREHSQDDSVAVAVVSALLDDELVICLCETWRLLDNKSQLRLCTDGAWRVVREGHAVASVGVLATVYDAHNRQFSTTFLELLLCITSSESRKAYEHIFDAWTFTLQVCLGIADPNSLVDQVHCDLALGIRAAIRSRFPAARICLDWSHFVAAVVNERVTAWRSGVWKVTQKHLKNSDLMAVVKTFFYGSRLLPRAAFGAFWSKAFSWLEKEGEESLVTAYQRNYFELNDDNQWTAEWAGSMDNTAASFYVGSQPQESWHKNRLRVSLGEMRLEASEVVEKLGGLMSSRTAQAELRQEMWYDVPTGEWIRSNVDAGNFLLKNSALFAREGLLETDITWKEQCRKRRPRRKAQEAPMQDSSDESSMGEALVEKCGTAQQRLAPEREAQEVEAVVEEVCEQEPPLASSSSGIPHPEPDAIPLPAGHVAPGSPEQLSKTVAKFGRPSTPTPKKDTRPIRRRR
eukprot:s120_g4.t1